MTNSNNSEIKKRALAAVREYGVQLSLFRNAMSEWAGFNSTDLECLRFLFQKQVATPSELSKHIGLTTGATTALLDRLEKAELIERHPNPKDRRGTLIVPAQSAQERMANWFASARIAQDELLSSYSEADLALIADVFEKFSRLWEQERGKLKA
ncbi:MAG TPA: MarR family transcriptional regulator [Anaerolineales bacterium]|nr:MarR family transcriptional regulator [Anaerolineales bacterium]